MKIVSDYSKKAPHIHVHENITRINKWGNKSPDDDYMNAIIDTKEGKINIFGFYGSQYDRIFKVGDIVEYDSYNLSYLGKIVKIGPKTISVDEHGTHDHITDVRIRRMDLIEFSWRNYNLDLEEIRKSNTETMYYI